MSLFQSNLRKQIRNLPKILNFVKIIHYFSKLFTGVLRRRAQLLLPWAHAKRRARMAMREAGAARFSREVGEPKGAVPLGNKERKAQTSINGKYNYSILLYIILEELAPLAAEALSGPAVLFEN